MLEIYFTRSSRNRMSSEAMHYLRSGNSMASTCGFGDWTRMVSMSPAQKSVFPGLPIQELATFMRRRTEMDEEPVRLCRAWVREQLAEGESVMSPRLKSLGIDQLALRANSSRRRDLG